jgi:hypothetical protein
MERIEVKLADLEALLETRSRERNHDAKAWGGRYHDLLMVLIGFMLTTVCGGLLTFSFNSQSKEKERRDVLRIKSISFLEETASDFNKPFSRTFGQIRSRNQSDINRIIEATDALFTKRLRVRVLSRAYLRSDHFSTDYDFIVFELSAITRQLEALQKGADCDKVAEYACHRVEHIRKEQGVDVGSPEQLESPYEELVEWTNLTWNLTSRVLADELIKATDR